MAEYELERTKIHFTWNPAHPPAITVEPGDVVHCWTQEVTTGVGQDLAALAAVRGI